MSKENYVSSYREFASYTTTMLMHRNDIDYAIVTASDTGQSIRYYIYSTEQDGRMNTITKDLLISIRDTAKLDHMTRCYRQCTSQPV